MAIDGSKFKAVNRRCSIKPLCTPAKERWIKRWAHEAVRDAMQRRLNQNPDIMGVRPLIQAMQMD